MTDLNVVTEMSESNPEVIDRVNDCIDFVNEQAIDSCAIVLISKSGEILDCWANGHRPYVMLGALEALKADYLDASIERR